MEKESVFEKPLEMDHREPAAAVDAAEFEKVLRSRRSIRVFDGTPVPASVMRHCLELALLAPNSSNLQPWEFYWVRSPEKRKELDRLCMSQPAATTAAEIVIAVARTDTWRKNSKQMLEVFDSMAKKTGQKLPKPALDYYRKLVPFAYSVGWFSVLAPFKAMVTTLAGFFRPVPREPLSRSHMRLWATKSAALACQNLMLAFRAHGFDTCPMEGLDGYRVRKLLGLPRGASVVMGISVGKRAPKGVYGPQVRFPSGQFIFEV